MTRKTVLNDAHRAAGARMVDFGGWDMPLHYGSQVDEHHQVRNDAGMFDVSHMTVVDLQGARTREFLRRLVANSVDKLHKPGKALPHALEGLDVPRHAQGLVRDLRIEVATTHASTFSVEHLSAEPALGILFGELLDGLLLHGASPSDIDAQ